MDLFARQRALEHFTIEKVVQMHRGLYNALGEVNC